MAFFWSRFTFHPTEWHAYRTFTDIQCSLRQSMSSGIKHLPFFSLCWIIIPVETSVLVIVQCSPGEIFLFHTRMMTMIPYKSPIPSMPSIQAKKEAKGLCWAPILWKRWMGGFLWQMQMVFLYAILLRAWQCSIAIANNHSKLIKFYSVCMVCCVTEIKRFVRKLSKSFSCVPKVAATEAKR